MAVITVIVLINLFEMLIYNVILFKVVILRWSKNAHKCNSHAVIVYTFKYNISGLSYTGSLGALHFMDIRTTVVVRKCSKFRNL